MTEEKNTSSLLVPKGEKLWSLLLRWYSAALHSLIWEACNGMFGNPAPGGFLNAPVADLTFKLAAAELAVLNVAAWNLYWDFDVILGMAKVPVRIHLVHISRSCLMNQRGLGKQLLCLKRYVMFVGQMTQPLLKRLSKYLPSSSIRKMGNLNTI